MPQIPIYDAPQIKPQEAPSPSLNFQAPNVGAAIGQGLQSAANTLGIIQQRADDLVSDERVNRFRQFEIQRKAALLNLQGEAAITPDKQTGLSPGQQALADIRAKADELSGDLGGGAKQAFTHKVAPHVLQFEGTTLEHFNHNQKVAAVQGLDAATELGVKDVVANPSAEALSGINIGDVSARAERVADILTLTGEIRSTFINERTSKIISATGHGLIYEGKHDLAKDYVDNTVQYANAGVTNDLGKVLNASIRTQQTNDLVSATVTQAKLGHMKWDAALDAMQEESYFQKLSPQEQNHAREQFIQAENQYFKQKNRDAAETSGAAYADVLKFGYNASVLKQKPAYKELAKSDAHAAEAFLLHINQTARQLAQPWPESPMQQAVKAANYYSIKEYSGFKDMSQKEILAYLPEVGPDYIKQLFHDQNQILSNPRHPIDIKLNADVAETAARKWEIYPKGGGKPSPEQEAKLASIKAQAQSIQQKAGGQFDYDEQFKLYEKLMKPIVVDGGLWNTTKPFYEVRASETIPQAFVEAINARAKEEGVAVPSDRRMYETWFEARKKGLVNADGTLNGSGQAAPPKVPKPEPEIVVPRLQGGGVEPVPSTPTRHEPPVRGSISPPPPPLPDVRKTRLFSFDQFTVAPPKTSQQLAMEQQDKGAEIARKTTR